MTASPTPLGVPVVDASAISVEEFARTYMFPRRPVLLRGAAAAWPAVGRWTPDFFREHFGDKTITVDSDDGQSLREFNFGEYIQIATDGTTPGRRLPYIRNLWLADYFPTLQDDILDCPFMTPNWFQVSPLRDIVSESSGGHWPRWLEFFFNAPGRRFPFVHIDTCNTHAWCAQIFGRKRFWLWEAAPARNGARYPCLRGDLATFFPDAVAHTGVASAGDIVFVPAAWYHTTESETVSITVSGNFINDSNWDDFCDRYFRQVLGLRLREALLSAGKATSG